MDMGVGVIELTFLGRLIIFEQCIGFPGSNSLSHNSVFESSIVLLTSGNRFEQ